jgi:hypothetical protein
MSYVINKTDGQKLFDLLDGTTNRETGLTLIGRNYTGYGEVQNENFIRLLENFANDVPPGESGAIAPLAGMLWWDTGTQRLKIFNGDSYASVSPIVDSATAPTSSIAGDMWWNTTTNQMKVWDGSAWLLLGPAYTTAQGKSGEFVETLTDNVDALRTVVVNYVNGDVVSINSSSTFILNPAVHGFTYVAKGINLPGNKVIEGNINIGGLTVLTGDTTINGKLYLSPGTGAAMLPGTTGISDIGETSRVFRDIHVGRNIVLTNANVFYSAKALVLQNKALDGNVDVYVNSSITGNTRVARVDGSTGLISVAGDPTKASEIATKGYTDTQLSGAVATLNSSIASTNGNVTQLRTDMNNNITSVLNTLVANVATINATDVLLNNRVTTLEIQVVADEVSNSANFALITSDISNINNQIVTFATINSPAFVGTPTAPTPASIDNSTLVATTAFVKTTTGGLQTDYDTKINNLSNATAANLSNGLALKADVNSPALTGTPTAPTPTSGDNSTKLATTAFVTGAVAARAFNYIVSENPPSGGTNGDFWFQIG